jgi:transcriptional regulator with XRE-family HTH domain
MEHPSPPNVSTAGSDQRVGERLKFARDKRGFTQGAVSVRSKMQDPEKRGISRTAIIAYEQGTSNPGLREIRLLCEVLHVTPNWLIFGTDAAGAATLPSMEMQSCEQLWR